MAPRRRRQQAEDEPDVSGLVTQEELQIALQENRRAMVETLRSEIASLLGPTPSRSDDGQRPSAQTADGSGQLVGTALTSQALSQTDRVPTAYPAVAKPDKFNGEGSWSSYLAQFEVVADANRWTEEQRASYLVSSLRGPAVAILHALSPEERRSFRHLTDALERRFGDCHQRGLFHAELRSRVQLPKETLSELAFDIERKVRVAFADCPQDVVDTVAVGYFIDAIAETDIQQAVRLAGPSGLRAALTRALEVDAARRAAKATQVFARALTSEAHAQSITPESAASLCEVNAVQTVTCWNCGGRGHLRRVCPSAPFPGPGTVRPSSARGSARSRRGPRSGNGN